ncbi:HAD-IIA family hydrolase [Halococcus thailandensis]|uniref:HAD-superfamily hydrolase n=1 Tax=Halococcus thailandensis JCM 13552 TaxID=1227457 RepID=M0NC68_9EURY|nr:HAD-IIA family hydrolase [Halococcus thailandensis]EMA54275.1 HAD-superfamily hydrolase [Halococcus thailandensis JCM 13552]
MPSRGAIVDLDGTVYRGDAPIPGARRGIQALRNAAYDLCFFSNNPMQTPAEFADRLAEMDLTVRPDEIESAGTVTVDYLAAEHAADRLFLIGAPGLRTQLTDADLTLTDEPETADVLVASYTRDFEYDDMTDGLRALDAGAAFVGTDPDVTIPTANGVIPGSGAIIRAIAGVAEREPDVIVGKPTDHALSAALATIDAAPENCLIVGDRLDTDIAMGARADIETVLVRTGTTDDDTLATSDLTPDHVLDSLGDIETVL